MIRLLAAALALFVLAMPLAHAQSDKELTKYQYWHVTSTTWPLTRTALGGLDACKLWISNYYPTYRLDPVLNTQPAPTSGPYTSHKCRFQSPNGSGGWTLNANYTATIGTCPADKPFFSKMLNTCQALEEPPPGTCSTGPIGKYDVTVGYSTGGTAGSAWVGDPVFPDASTSFCVDSCSVKQDAQSNQEGNECHVSTTPSPNGYYPMTCQYDLARSGGECTGPGGPPATQPEPDVPNTATGGKCPAGSVASGQDSYGMTICIGTAKPPTPPSTTVEKPPVTTPNPDGGSTTKNESTTTNADGSTTTTTTTTVTGPDGTKSTTVDMQTTAGASGAPGTQDKPEDKSDLCKQNPHLNICKNSQVTGTCGQISCTGDAIQCATARAVAAMECKQRADQEEIAALPATSLGLAIGAGADPMQEQIDAALAGTTVDLSSPNLDQNGFIGGGSCFPNKTMHFGSQAITVDFSSVCEDIQPLRYAVLSVSLIMAYLIVSRSILGA